MDSRIPRRLLLSTTLAIPLAAAAGCGDNAPFDSGLRFAPEAVSLKVGGAARFALVHASGARASARFEVDGAGSIDETGRYQAPREPAGDAIRAIDPDTGLVLAEALVTVEPYAGALAAHAPSTGFRSAHAAVRLDGGDGAGIDAAGSVLLVGSVSDGRLERFAPERDAFVPAGDLGAARWDLAIATLPGGGVLIAGGRLSRATADAAVYRGDRVEPIAAMAEARYAHRAAALPGGEVLVTGGLPRTGPEVPALASAERYDPASRSFRATGAMTVARSGHTATTLRDGRVLVAGGRDSTCIETCPQRFWATAELYDPATGAFTATGAMAISRADHTATLLDDGRVLIAGGTTPDLAGTDLANSVEIYDPATGAFTPAGAMLRRRSEHTATLLLDGRVLLAHGRTQDEGTLASATVEAFDPATGASTLASSPSTTRYRHTATLLESGRVLIAGGTEGGGALDRVELFE